MAVELLPFLAAIDKAAASIYQFLCGAMFSLLFFIHLGLELLGHVLILFNQVRNNQAVCQSGRTIL